MFDELFSPLPSVEKYLDRINYNGPRSVSRETLDGLVTAHVRTVPFENLDFCYTGGPASLTIPDLYDKVVTRRRGGYCFELNAIFTALLRELGFDCYSVAGRVLMGRDFRPMLLHRSIVVNVGGERLFCDVGFGGPVPDLPVNIDSDKPQLVPSGEFILTRNGDNEVTLCRIADGRCDKLIMFLDCPFDERDFTTMNYYSSHSPQSSFVIRRTLNLRTGDGAYSISDDILRIRSGDDMQEIELDTPEALDNALKKYFGIYLNPDEKN